MDLARDAGALLGDRAAELRRVDRAPDADEEHDVGEQAQEVALRHVPHRDHGLEEEVERREQRQRRAERKPAVEILATPPVAVGEPDHGDEVHERERGEAAAPERLVRQRSGRAERRQPGDVRHEPDREQPDHGDRDGHVGERDAVGARSAPGRAARTRAPSSRRARCRGTATARPRSRCARRPQGRARRRATRPTRREPAAEQQVVAATLDHEPDPVSSAVSPPPTA